MASRERVGVIGARRGRQQLVTALADFREGRLQGSISQAQVAAAIGRSRTWVTWTEAGQNQRLSVVELSQLLACVGLELSVRAYPAGRGLRDEPQLRLLAGLRQLVQHAWRWRGEVGMPLPGDLRAWDAALSNGRCEIGPAVIRAATRSSSCRRNAGTRSPELVRVSPEVPHDVRVVDLTIVDRSPRAAQQPNGRWQ